MKDVSLELISLLDLTTERLNRISEADAAIKPSPDKWSKKEILGHLVDSALNNHQRFVRMQLQDHLELPGYEQDDWVRIQGYQQMEWKKVLSMWESHNRRLAELIERVNPAALKNTWNAPDGETVDLEFVIRDYVRHQKHHLAQILP